MQLKKSFFMIRSRVYLYLVPIVGIFYFVPAIQHSALAKEYEQRLGNQDLCYHNFRSSYLKINVFTQILWWTVKMWNYISFIQLQLILLKVIRILVDIRIGILPQLKIAEQGPILHFFTPFDIYNIQTCIKVW